MVGLEMPGIYPFKNMIKNKLEAKLTFNFLNLNLFDCKNQIKVLYLNLFFK